GGDEFVVLLREVTAEEDASAVGEKILAQMCRPFVLHGREVCISPRIGVSVYPRDAVTPEALKSCADIAMYSAKRGGRGACRRFSEEIAPPQPAEAACLPKVK